MRERKTDREKQTERERDRDKGEKEREIEREKEREKKRILLQRECLDLDISFLLTKPTLALALFQREFIIYTQLSVYNQFIDSVSWKNLSYQGKTCAKFSTSDVGMKLKHLIPCNGTPRFNKCKQLFEYQHLLLHRDIRWSKF